MDHMKTRVMLSHRTPENEVNEDYVDISEDSIRLLLVDQVEKHVSQRVTKSNLLHLAVGNPDMTIK
jgi:hypothetical protein